MLINLSANLVANNFAHLHIVSQTDFLHYLTNSEELLNTLLASLGGWMIAVVALIVFIESGVIFPVLPGDSMIFTLGIIYTHIPNVPLWLMFLILFTAAILGNCVGYWLGLKYGRGLFKEKARFLTIENRKKAEDFFDKHGGMALVLARFVPFVRTFVPIVAGIGKYKFSAFIMWNIAGAALWIITLLTAGVTLGSIPAIANNIEMVAVVIVLFSCLPIIFGYIKKKIEDKKQVGATNAEEN